MPGDDDVRVRVHSSWDGWPSAQVRLSHLHDVHWSRPQGAPHAVIQGYVSCTNAMSGDLVHTCHRGSAPHRLRVYVLKGHTLPALYAELARRCDEHAVIAAVRGPLFDRRSRQGRQAWSFR